MLYWFPAELRERLTIAALPVMLGIGAFLVGVGSRDEARLCLQEVVSFVREVDFTLPPDPAVKEFLLHHAEIAHGLCERGRRQEAENILLSLRNGLGV